MNTTAMVLTITGFCFCFVPGIAGWCGIFLAALGSGIGVMGLTNTKTSPSGLGMDVAAWIYGIITVAFGASYQIKVAHGALDNLLLPLSLQMAITVGVSLFVLALVVQILARKHLRYGGIGLAMILFSIICASTWTALIAAERAGIQLL